MPPVLTPLTDTDAAPLAKRRLRVADALALPAFAGARPIAGAAGLERTLAHVNVMQLPTAEFARPDELILVATSAFDELTAAPETLVAALAARGVAAIAGHASVLDRFGPAGCAAAEAADLPLVRLPAAARLNTLLTELLEQLVSSRASELRAAGAARDELVEEVLAEGGLDRLVATIARLAQAAVAVFGEDGVLLAATGPGEPHAAARVAHAWLRERQAAPAGAEGWVVWPIVAAGARLGCLVAEVAADDDVALATLRDGARSVAFELLHTQEEAAALARLNERFVLDLLRGALDPEAAHQRAALVGVEPAARYRVLLADGPAELAAIARDEPAIALTARVDGALLALLQDGDGDRAAGALLDAVPDAHVGVSRPRDALAELPRAHAEAAEALRCARRFARRTRAHTFDPTSPLRLLVRVPEPELRAFADDTLRPLDALPPAQREPLAATLDVLIATGLNVAETARRGDWHYNTVRYRLARLGELLGPFAREGARLDALALALLLRRELPGEPAATSG